MDIKDSYIKHCACEMGTRTFGMKIKAGSNNQVLQMVLDVCPIKYPIDEIILLTCFQY